MSKRSTGLRLARFSPMRILVTWGSKRGGTAGIARTLADDLRARGLIVEARPARSSLDLRGFDAVVVGGALYANRWHPASRRFVERRIAELRRIPVWFFSSGPLDDSAAQTTIPPPLEVEVLMERLGARGHITFGGRLERNARGFPASAMARKHAGDWRRPEQIAGWADKITHELPSARPNPVIELPARSVSRLLTYAAGGWAASAVILAGLLALVGVSVAIAIHALTAPIVFGWLAVRYFRGRGARAPFLAAATFSAATIALDLIVGAIFMRRSRELLTSAGGVWLPAALILLATWGAGAIMAMRPSRAPVSP